ncbi:MAG: hypothetical protein ACRDQU_18350 [Pseudonocardiaceae bacterium]
MTRRRSDLTRAPAATTSHSAQPPRCKALGAATSTTLAGAIIVVGGYNLAVLTLTGIAVLALLLLIFVVPETAVSDTTAVHDGGRPPSPDPRAGAGTVTGQGQ